METEALLQRFLAQYSKPATKDAHGKDLAQFTSFLNGKPLRQVTAQDIGTFASWLTFHEWRRAGQSGRYSPASTARKLDSVRRFIKWLVEQGLSHIPEHELAAATAVDRTQHNAARRERRRHHVDCPDTSPEVPF